MTVHIDPILIELGPIRVSWYGLMYILASLPPIFSSGIK